MKKVDYHDSDSKEGTDDEITGDRDINEDIYIIYGEFVKNVEMCLKCVMFARWAHKDCTSPEKDEIFM